MGDYPVEAERPAPLRSCTAPWDHTQFALKLLVYLVRANPRKNVFVSPAGVVTAMLVLYNGASQSTRQAIAEALGVNEAALETLNAAGETWLSSFLGSQSSEIVIATSVWFKQGLSADKAFAARIKRHYGADMEERDAARMNAWISRKTGGKIRNLAAGVSAGAELTVLNAVYFKGTWAVPFDPQRTGDGTFTRSDNSCKKLPMMWREGVFHYLQGPGFKAVHLLYAGKEFGMYVIVPDTPLQDFLAKLNISDWEGWKRQLRLAPGAVSLPRFRIEYDTSLLPAVRALGFDAAAGDYSSMEATGAPLPLSEANHATCCVVNEAGTEATSLTELKLLGGAGLVANRPFLCAIEHEPSGSLVFLGAIEDPQ